MESFDVDEVGVLDRWEEGFPQGIDDTGAGDDRAVGYIEFGDMWDLGVLSPLRDLGDLP